MNVLALCNDMIFRTKIESAARSLGCAVVRAVDVIEADGGIVLIDLDTAWPVEQATLVALKGNPHAQLVAFGSHVRADLFAEARAAGIDEVMARSAFVSKLPAMLSAKGA